MVTAATVTAVMVTAVMVTAVMVTAVMVTAATVTAIMVIIMVTIITIMGMATVTIITIIGMATVTIITIIGMATVTADGGTVTGTVMASAHAGSGSNLMVTFGTATERREGGLAEAWERTAAPGLTSRGRRPPHTGIMIGDGKRRGIRLTGLRLRSRTRFPRHAIGRTDFQDHRVKAGLIEMTLQRGYKIERLVCKVPQGIQQKSV